MIPYLDASVITPLLVNEASSNAVLKFMLALTTRPLVSEFAAAETASALSRLVRMKFLSAQSATEALARFDTWRATTTLQPDILPEDFQRATQFVRRFDLMLRAPDALHAALCHRLAATLVTLDQRLATAATSLAIPVLVPPPA